MGRAQTDRETGRGLGLRKVGCNASRMVLGKPTREGESPVREVEHRRQDPKYRETRGTLREDGGTTPQG